MMMSRSVKNVSKSTRCTDDPGVLEPKKFVLVGMAMFILGMFVGRLYNALQRAGLAGSPNVMGGFHLHHWMYSLIALIVLFPLAFYFNTRNKTVFTVTIVLIFFFTGLFVDGIVYPDSFIFYE
jgi:hypothetical protein